MQRAVISGGTVVLPDSVLEAGSVVIEDGAIAGVIAHPLAHAPDNAIYIDAAGRLVLPGLVDLHNDAIEVELSPRPRAALPFELAVATLDRRLAAAGVTTEFAAVFFGDMTRNERSLAEAPLRAERLLRRAAEPDALVDQHVLFRADVWVPESLETALACAARARVPLVSLNDHTPGQGQYRDVATWRRYQIEHLGRTEEEVEAAIAAEMERARLQPTIAESAYRRAAAAAAAGHVLLVSHDDDTPEKVTLVHGLGARIAEFPVTIEAARQARALGMTIVAGAPNIVRGGSASGNLDARALVAEGLLDALCADYHAPSMLHAALQLVREGALDLPAAVRAIALNPARAVGLGTGQGSLEEGKRGDVIVVDARGATPLVELTLRGGAVTFWSPRARVHACAITLVQEPAV
jgi:alpha-D-ribose 1-methylphosphonate 5-triphosphate diphosphatase